MTKKICVIIGLIMAAFWAYTYCLYAYDERDWVHDEEIFAAVAMVVSAVLMLIAWVKADVDDMKTTTVLFSIASVLFFIGSIALLYRQVNSHYYHDVTGKDVRAFFVFNGPLIVLWIIYGVSKTPEKVEKPKVPQTFVSTLVNMEITDEDRKKYAEQVARSSMYELKVYVFDKKGTYEPALAALALEEIREREAGRRKRLTEEDIPQ